MSTISGFTEDGEYSYQKWLKDEEEEKRKQVAENKYWHHVIGLHFLPDVTKIKWYEWRCYIDQLFAELKLEINCAAIQCASLKEPPRALRLKEVDKIAELCNYQDIRMMELLSLFPEDVAELGIKKYIARSYIWPSIRRFKPISCTAHTTMCLLIEDKYIDFNLTFFNKIAKKFHELTGGLYGYYYKYFFNGDPNSYLTGLPTLIVDYNNREEKFRIEKWMTTLYRIADASAAGKEFNQQVGFNSLRDIFRINFLSPHHLELVIDNAGTKLGDWISKGTESNRGKLGQLSKDFYYWHVEDAELQIEIRNQLAPSGRIICI